jgi:hypothetical protein
VALGGAVCICVLNLLGNTVRGTGNMSLPATVLIGCVLAHIALAPVLIFGLGPVPALGPAGAAWGLKIPFGVGRRDDRLFAFIACDRPFAFPRRHAALGAALSHPQGWRPGLDEHSDNEPVVAALTGIAGQLGPETALGYAMGARLEYILQPVTFGFGIAMVSMVGTNWGVGASIAALAKSHGPARPPSRCCAARLGPRWPSTRRYGSACSATMKTSPG